jgi:cysteine desulfurase/selenocysteine lyase
MFDADLLQKLRGETPGWGAGTHLNHAGASLMPATAHAAIAEHLALEARLGPMDAAAAMDARLAAVRGSAARLLNADASEIAILSSGSAAFGAAFSALPRLRAGDRILVGRQEWGGNLANYERAARAAGAAVEAIPCRDDGSVDAGALAKHLDERVRLISLTWMPANGGLVNDAEAIGRVARDAGIPYLVDAGQAAGQIPIDVKTLLCDVLKTAARKHLRGPRGTALLYVRRDFLARMEPPWVDVLSAPWTLHGPQLRDDARRFETSEVPVALWLALGVSLELALGLGIDSIATRVQALAGQLRETLESLPGVVVRDLGTGPKSGIVSFTVAGQEAMSIKSALAQSRIHVGANGVPYTPLDMQARGLDAIVRASISYLNSESDLEILVERLRTLVH